MRTHVCQTVSPPVCCIASAAQHSFPRLGDPLSVACYCFSTQPAGLRYWNADRPADPPYPPPSVCAECCGTTDISSPPIRPHHGRRKGLCSRSQCRLTGHCTVMPLNTCGSLHQSPTSRPDKDFGLPPRTICAFLPSDCLLLDVVLSLSLALVFGTLFLPTSLQHLLCSLSENV